ncbi:exportin-6-like [Lingula anatina]|uniref:Exportin-6-like n=1 Tax=Lingula anatina TaxID=7574 RepID=A0A1S3ITZ6_LINAN|nr:exportin-6-like [Lingula anatina]|eukprot:XP_013401009.1 exportin-6-like [Lingula anatina]
MATDESSLRTLEGLMSEFFDARTTNERKRQIEELLNHFSQQRDAWHHSLYFLANTKNNYVMMFCLTVLDNLINKQWLGLEASDKMEIRNTLNRFLLEHHTKVPVYIRNKLCKLVVDIGRLDWPHFYPDFFTSMLQLIQHQETVILGIVLIQTSSEELACPREDLSAARKDELNRLLLQQVPTMLSLISNTLEAILEKHRHLVAATPPPSPTQGQVSHAPAKSATFALFTNDPIQPSQILKNMFSSPAKTIKYESIPPLDSESHHTCVLALNCLSHLFSWIPLSTTITPNLLSTIFHFAAFGCESASVHNRSSGGVSSDLNGSYTTDSESLGVLAMCCINELLSKNCVPQEFEDFLLQMFQQTFYLLQRLTKESTTTSSGNKLEELDESYIEKFTEFLRLFVSIHLRRFEDTNSFPVLEFLALLFKYTFKQPTHEGYYGCLDIWTIFLDYLNVKLTNRALDVNAIISKYKEALVSLVSQILQKLQFRFNQSQLETLDDETLDDDSETEWQHFLRQSLENVAKVAEILPPDVFRIVYQPFSDNMEIYLGLEQFLTNGPQGRKLNIPAENECRRLHCSMRDLSSSLQALGRLVDHFIGEFFSQRLHDAQTLISKVVQCCVYGTKVKLYEVSTFAQNVLHADFIEVHAQALAAMKAYSHWLAEYYVESYKHQEQRQKCEQLIMTVVHTCIPLFEKEIPDKIVHSAAHLLLTLMTTVRPAFLLRLPEIQTLYNKASQGSCADLTTEVQLLLYRALSNHLLLPWPNLAEGDQDWQSRAAHHETFIKQLTTQYQQLKTMESLAQSKSLQDQAKPCVKWTLQLLTDQVSSIAADVVKSKQICCQSIHELIQTTMTLFPVYMHQTDVLDDMLGFFLTVFEGLRVQMGVSFTERTIQTFMSLFTREQLSEIITNETSTGFRVVEKFLKILQFVVQEPGAAFRAFLPGIIVICMDQIYPLLAQRPTPDIKATFYELLYIILLHNWRYFFKPGVVNARSSIQTAAIAATSKQNEQVEHQPQFISILQAFGQSFLQPDIGIFRQNLEYLEELNEKWKLYQKNIFKEVMLFQFLNVFIQVLIHRSHDLLQEEIGITIYNMAAVDFDKFYSAFLPQFLNGTEGLDENQRTILAQNFEVDKDLPTFTQNVHRLVNDLRYYRLCNSSLPAGSFKFG